MIKMLRIDHRLVHGQVAFSWSHFIGTTRIIVIDDKAANDELQKMALMMSKPSGCKLNIFTVEKALSKMQKVEGLNDNVFIVFGCTSDAARFICAYPKFKELNLGGIAKKEGSKEYSQVIYLTPQEEIDVKKIQEAGIDVYMQQLPTTKREELKL